MKKHTKIYLKALGYDLSDPGAFVPSEISGAKAQDLHHIVSRGKGGKDRIENLMALTREEHVQYGDKKIYMPYLLEIHFYFLVTNNVEFDYEYLTNLIKKYD